MYDFYSDLNKILFNQRKEACLAQQRWEAALRSGSNRRVREAQRDRFRAIVFRQATRQIELESLQNDRIVV